jgi:hypothetical protein
LRRLGDEREEATRNEIAKIVEKIPAHEPAIRWDCSTEVQDAYGAIPGFPLDCRCWGLTACATSRWMARRCITTNASSGIMTLNKATPINAGAQDSHIHCERGKDFALSCGFGEWAIAGRDPSTLQHPELASAGWHVHLRRPGAICGDYWQVFPCRV